MITQRVVLTGLLILALLAPGAAAYLTQPTASPAAATTSVSSDSMLNIENAERLSNLLIPSDCFAPGTAEPHSPLSGEWQCWSNPDSLPCYPHLQGVDMVSAIDGWAVGYNSIVHWNGQTWQVHSGVSEHLFTDVDMISTSDGWAVALGTTYEQTGSILRWNGSQWKKVPSPPARLVAIEMLSATDGWAVGEQIGSGGGTVLHWNGSTWTRGTIPPDPDFLSSVSFVSANDGWVVGLQWYQGYIAHWDGSNWTRVSSPTTEWLYAVDMVSSTDGWAVGNRGVILRWNGSSWAQVASPTTNSLNTVVMTSATRGWAMGAGGTILQWDGTTWSLVTSSTSTSLNGGSMVSGQEGWAVGDGGTILHWNGSTWSETMHPNPFVYAQIGAIDMVSQTDGWAVGGSTIGHWNGATWTSSNYANYGLSDVAMVNSSDGWAVGGSSWISGITLHWDGYQWTEAFNPASDVLRSVAMVSATDGWAVGGTTGQWDCQTEMIHWDGSSWRKVTPPASCALNSVDAVSTNDVWVVGSSGQILHWNGSQWNQVSSPTSVDLYAVDMLSAVDGWAVGYGTILHWNGSDWMPAIPAYTGGGHVKMISENDGWITGYSIPLHWDGVTWTQVIVPPSGAVVATDFLSSSDGWGISGYSGPIYRYTDTWQPETVWHSEAEAGILAGSMQLGTDPSGASACQFVFDDGSTPGSTVTFTMTVPYDDDFYLWARAMGVDWDKNSFFVSVDGGALFHYELPMPRGGMRPARNPATFTVILSYRCRAAACARQETLPPSPSS